VRIRGEQWRLAGEATYDGTSIIDVDGCDASNRGLRAQFILPLEPVEHLSTRRRSPQMVTFGRWRRVARASLAAAVPDWTSLRAAARADLAIIPFQLEPALAVTSGDGCRLLIADDVGLGKTVQAGLIVAETVARAADARVLIVAPAGLRHQWSDELRSRFSLTPELLDAGGIARTGALLAPDVNPWSVHPIAITSIDYVKRPDVIRALEPLIWDVIVFDEAHTLGGRSDRAAAAAALAGRARCVVMLTATPHSGDEDMFARLCALGDLEGSFPLLTFRRTRADVGLPDARRSTLLRVRPTGAEIAAHVALAEYATLTAQHADGTETDAAAALVIAILERRACSSAHSLARSLERRLAILNERPDAGRDQLALPFLHPDDDDEPGAELGVFRLPSVAEERSRLERLCVLAHAASHDESKVHALRRFLKRSNQPAVVFTEYRDTLQHLAAALSDFDPLQLHGGLGSSERRSVVRQFTTGGGRVLLATDAASEGLNLQHRCRLVVNLELPWTPPRLEQRIGRVDRLGQQRRVHAVQLIAAGTCEEAAVSRFIARAHRISAALEERRATTQAAPSPLRTLSEIESARLSIARELSADRHIRMAVDRPVVTIRRHARGRAGVWAVRLPVVDTHGHLVFETIVGLRDVRGVMNPDEALTYVAAAHHQEMVADLSTRVRPSLELSLRREDAIIGVIRVRQGRLSAALLQRGLFDRRSDHAAAARAAILDDVLLKSAVHVQRLHRLDQVAADSPSVVFGIVFR
jgi:superfamily II DNA or RNA helicase